MSSQHLALDTIYQGDCLDILPTLPAMSVDMIFADPPYNLQLEKELWRPNLTPVDAVDDEWDRFDSFADYDTFTRNWLAAARRIMKDTSTIWVSGTYHNIFRVGAIMQDLGFWLLNTVTWYRTNAMPNFRGTRLKNDVEFIIWAKRSKTSTYAFNYHKMKQFNDGKQLGSVWQIPICGRGERLKGENGKKLHSTQKPEALLHRIILASSNVGDIVLDPFLGTGTTAAVAKQLHRHWIGMDANELYIEAARNRINNTIPLPTDDPDLTVRKKPRRVPFHKLLEHQYLSPNQRLYLKKTDHVSTIMPDGSIKLNGYVGSIHDVAKRVKNLGTCNGWTQWYYLDEETGEKHLIDALRDRFREENSDW